MMLRLLVVNSYKATYNYIDFAAECPLLFRHTNLLHLSFK
jgi:hypothetical protein